MILSIIIPAFNCSSTIEALLQSILNNQLNKEDYEVIICDDNSTDMFMLKVEKFKTQMNIIYCKTNTNVHCPGNTRQAGLILAKGDWITFIDNDDVFTSDGLRYSINLLKTNQFKYCLVSQVYTATETGFIIEQYKDLSILLHGKFFNRKNLIEAFNLCFKKDLLTSEDLYFNNLALCVQLLNNSNFNIVPIVSYIWIQRPQSLSHLGYETMVNRTDIYLEDYLEANIKIFVDFINKYQANLNNFYYFLFTNFYFIYLYYCILPYRITNADLINKNKLLIKNCFEYIKNQLNFSNTDVIIYVNKLINKSEIATQFKDQINYYNITTILTFESWLDELSKNN